MQNRPSLLLLDQKKLSVWTRCKRLIRSSVEHPGAFVALAIGFLAGLFLRLPLIHWELPAPAASVLGSLAGATVGAGTAALIANEVVNRRDRNACRTVARTIRPIATDLSALHDVLKTSNSLTIEYVLNMIKPVHQEVKRQRRRLDILRSTTEHMKSGGSLGFADAEAALGEMASTLNAAVESLGHLVASDAGGEPFAGDRFHGLLLGRLEKTYDELASALDLLGHPIRDVADVYK